MCGFVGFLENDLYKSDCQIKQSLFRLIDPILHRGPDGSGVWFDRVSGIGLAHCRLAVMDVSSNGAQPMVSTSGRYVIVFNGEIYNHNEIRKEINLFSSTTDSKYNNWKGKSDTETILEAIEAWGIDKALKMSVGMFAFALWDKKNRSLILARDRIGEKPLYYGWENNNINSCFLFGSDLSALRLHEKFNSSLSKEAIALYFQHNYIPAPYSIYKNYKKLLPGHYLIISKDPNYNVSLNCYWNIEDVIQQSIKNPFIGNINDASIELEYILNCSLRGQMISDVPIGAFLSGGIDSSTIVALTQRLSLNPVKTFTIGFDDSKYNEAIHAKKIAKSLGTNHSEYYVSPDDALNLITQIPKIYTEPFADSSQIPTIILTRLMRDHVTVALSGDGGDELFGGYNRYIQTDRYWYLMNLIPIKIRKLLQSQIDKLTPNNYDLILRKLDLLITDNNKNINWSDKISKASSVLGSETIDELYKILTLNNGTENFVKNLEIDKKDFSKNFKNLNGINNTQKMMLYDTVNYLPDDILVKVDRASMFASLETRAPFLDHRIIEFSWSLPFEMKLKNGVGKIIIKKILEKYCSNKLFNRPKMGFSIPLESWLRGPLKSWAEDLLSPIKIEHQGHLNSSMISKMWKEHLLGHRNWHNQLWAVLMFQAWLEENPS